MGTFGVPELLIILLIVIVLFGASRLAGIGSAIGTSVREFRRTVKEDDEPTATRPVTRDGERADTSPTEPV